MTAEMQTERYFVRHIKYPSYWPIAFYLEIFNAQAHTISYTKIHENPNYDREDTELKVIYSPRNVPFITGQSQSKITTINTHACTVWDIKFHENRSFGRRAI